MAHVHAPSKDYYLDQFCTIGACAALGIIGVMLYVSDRLLIILVPAFHPWVLGGSIVLLGLALIRGIVVWREAGRLTEPKPHHHHEHKHDHEHCAHDHPHDHEHCAHEHHHDDAHEGSCEHLDDCGHDHSHTWVPAKYAVLLLPVILYLLDLPNAAFSATYLQRAVEEVQLEQDNRAVESKGVMNLGFRELADASFEANKTQREKFEGATVRLRGQFSGTANDKVFTLIRLNRKCCGADAIPIGVTIIAPARISQMATGDWVAVEGKVMYHKLLGKNKLQPVLLLDSTDQVKKIPPEPNPFEDS